MNASKACHPKTKKKNAGKLEPNLEGSYAVVARGGNGSYTTIKTRRHSGSNKLFAFEAILCTRLLHSMGKVRNSAPYLSQLSQNSIKKLISGPYPDGLDLHEVTLEWWQRSWWSLPIWSHSWMTKALLMVTQKSILGPHPDGSNLYGVTPEWRKRSCYLYRVTFGWRKRSWWSLWQCISGPNPDHSDLHRVTSEWWKHSWWSLPIRSHS